MKKPQILLSFLGVAVLLSACGIVANKMKPAWVRGGANLDHPDYYMVVGSCREQETALASRRCALAAARRQIRDVFGAPGGLVRDEYVEYRRGVIKRGDEWLPHRYYSTWILMIYPRKKPEK